MGNKKVRQKKKIEKPLKSRFDRAEIDKLKKSKKKKKNLKRKKIIEIV